MNDWVTPKRDDVLSEGYKNESALLLENIALCRPGTERFSVLVLGKSGQIGLPISTTADGYLPGVWWMWEQFLVQIFFHRNVGRETHSETPVCVSQDGLSVLTVT